VTCVTRVGFIQGASCESDALRFRRPVITLVVLCAAVLAVVIGLSLLGHTSPAIQVIPFALSVPLLSVGWLTYRDAKRAADRTSLSQVADDLADTVRRQWEIEAQFRHVNDSDILTVTWEPAAPDLVEKPQDTLGTLLADSGGILPISGLKRRPSQLAGHGWGQSLASGFKRVPSGRLVVLGDGGSGKTVQLIRLLLDLHKERERGTAVPVIVPLASWDPSQSSLKAWLISRLTLDYPSLKAPWETSARPCCRAEALLDQHLLLILDGLDEVPAHVRTTAISRINQFLRPGAGLVLSCRTEEYRDALSSSGSPGRPVKLTGATGVTLRPLSGDAIRHYLLGDAGPGSAPGLRWSPVLRELSAPGSPVAEALQTPLIAALARDVYEPQLTGLPEPKEPREPEELTNQRRFGDAAAIKQHLFEVLIQNAYQPKDDPYKKRWRADEAQEWLSFLAHHLRARDEEYNFFAWWELREAAPQWLVLGTVGAICGLAAGIAAGLGAHVGQGIGVGLGAGAIIGLAGAIPIRRVSKSGTHRRHLRGAARGVRRPVRGRSCRVAVRRTRGRPRCRDRRRIIYQLRWRASGWSCWRNFRDYPGERWHGCPSRDLQRHRDGVVRGFRRQVRWPRKAIVPCPVVTARPRLRHRDRDGCWPDHRPRRWRPDGADLRDGRGPPQRGAMRDARSSRRRRPAHYRKPGPVAAPRLAGLLDDRAIGRYRGGDRRAHRRRPGFSLRREGSSNTGESDLRRTRDRNSGRNNHRPWLRALSRS